MKKSINDMKSYMGNSANSAVPEYDLPVLYSKCYVHVHTVLFFGISLNIKNVSVLNPCSINIAHMYYAF